MRTFVTVAATALVLSGGAVAGTGLFWEPTAQDAAKLTASCGRERALNIARIEWARDIHVGYINEIRQGIPLPAQDSDPAWHGYWVHVYNETIKLLKQDCSG